MDIDLTNPQDATGAANTPTLTKEFIPSLGVTEIPDFETFSLDPDKYLAQVVDPNAEGMQPTVVEEPAVQTQTQMQDESLPPVEGAETQEVQTQSQDDLPSVPASGAQEESEGSGEQVDEPEKETLQ